MSDTTTEPIAWLCRVDGQEVVIWSHTIEDARLQARHYYQAPNAAVSARIATRHEKGEKA